MSGPTPPFELPADAPEDPASLSQDNREIWLQTTTRLSQTHQGNPAANDNEPYLPGVDWHDFIVGEGA